MSRVTDPEVLAFIRRTEESYPGDSNQASAAENRRNYDAMCAVFHRPHPAGVTAADRTLGGVSCRIYERSDPVAGTVLFSHGGGFVVGGLDSHDDVCAEICAATGRRVVSVDYRLAPEHVHPAALDDVTAVWQALDGEGPRLACGDSAGGNLTAALCLRMRRLGSRMPDGAVLIYPGLGSDMTAPSFDLNAEAPLLRREDLMAYKGVHAPADSTDPEARPLLARDLTGLPPMLIVTADVDPLRDEGTMWNDALRDAGITSTLRNDAQLVHGHLRARHMSKRAADSFAAVCDWLAR
ncbi:alpha/beta hydrolase [Jannaschia rubra]|uniref:alpha/beta hydrolase n=1 Tax=Jannaschia rubra TaxID=282197 RepID=UPI0024927E79|nr:alpha/beta hydrolase [Jannaschia rubra]